MLELTLHGCPKTASGQLVKLDLRLCPETFGLSTQLSSHPVLYFTLTTGGWVGSLRNLSAALLPDTAPGCIEDRVSGCDVGARTHASVGGRGG